MKLFSKSLLKQQKLKAIQGLLGSTIGMECLDIGGDNGVICHFLRKSGGRWMSGDMSPKAVSSIGKLVGEDHAVLLEGFELPFDDNSMDQIVIIDYLEHLDEDELFVQECHRVLRPNGVLIANVPHNKKLSVIRILHKILGLTDEMHGHVRPGYSQADMYRLMRDGFDITQSQTYSRFFVQLIDTGVQWVNSMMGGKSQDEGPSKGVMIDEEDMLKYQKAFTFFRLIFPLLKLASLLDHLLFFTKGHSLIVRAKCRPWIPRREVKIADGRSIADATINTKIGTAGPF